MHQQKLTRSYKTMLKVSVLSTGSQGNSCILDNGETKLLLDAGISTKEWKLKASEQGYEMKDMDALLITHAHNDHVATSANNFIKEKGNKNLYTTPTVANDISRKCKLSYFTLAEVRELEFHKKMVIGAFEVMPVKMYHFGIGKSRINECIGFEIFDAVNKKKILYASDTNSLQSVNVPEGGYDLIMLEANHDRKYVDEIYEMSSKSPEDNAKYARTKDHLSIQDLSCWLLEHQHDGIFVPLHESSRYLRPGKTQLKDRQFYGEFWKEKQC